MRSAVTVSLVPEAIHGPFVFHDGLVRACEAAAALGFDAIEIFAPRPDAIDDDQLRQLLDRYGLAVAAVGTGAGMIKHGLSLTDGDADRRTAAIDFVAGMIQFGARWDAPAIIGSMQGKWGGSVDRDAAMGYLKEALEQLGPVAAGHGVDLLLEPLNRYETNLLRRIDESVAMLETLATANVKLLADLFHMNIEEADIAAAIRCGGRHIGHVHFVDSNRQAAGLGHIDYPPIMHALKSIDYRGYLSAEAFPMPDAMTAATATADAINRLVGNNRD